MPRWDILGLSSADDNLIVKTSYGGVAPGPMRSQPSPMLFHNVDETLGRCISGLAYTP